MNILQRAIVTSAPVVLLAVGLQAQSVPEITYDSVADLLKTPAGIYLGEVSGVATNSKGNIFVYTRTGRTDVAAGNSRLFTHGGSRLFEFDKTGRYVREIGQGVYGFVFAEAVRIDPRDNIWVVDRGSSMLIKFDPEGRIVMTLGRKPEAVQGVVGPIPAPARGGAAQGPGREGGPGRAPAGPPGAGVPGDNFSRPTDIAWDSAGNLYVADGYGNARVAKFNADGKFLKSWGSRGSQQGQFETLLSIAVDAKNNIFVADRGNKRIQVFDAEGTFQREITGVGAPWAICISPGAHQYLYSSNSNDTGNLDFGEIYRMELDGKVLGKFGRAGKLAKEFGTVNSMDCRNPEELIVAEVGNWRAQRVSLKASR